VELVKLCVCQCSIKNYLLTSVYTITAGAVIKIAIHFQLCV